ncbi:hypothetical protein [uncultured Tateyamaria sp.]|uniref:hypothetical protein n=1 Tax=uncultured Tateyamaria sp. TaxID=455651 RepID=UPI002639FE8B|nr:hypothetical protein [uncultured Tateyamaria sp.]
MQKPRLYALLGRTPRLNSSRGDLINEMRSLRILSTHFDVYYNNERFVEGLTEIGNPSGLGPDTEYDYYYLRNSPDVFSGIDGRRIAFAYPYDSQTFENAYGLIVPTANWKRHLLAQTDDSRRKVSDAYGCDIPTVTAPVLVVGQSQDPGILKEVTNERDIFPLRTKTTMAAKIFGYYGNLSNDLYPRMAFRALERLADEQGTGSDILVVLAGHFRKNSKISLRKGVHIGNVPYDKIDLLP